MKKPVTRLGYFCFFQLPIDPLC